MIRKKLGYIANRENEKVETDDYGNELEVFKKPFAFNELYMPVTDSYSLKVYGENIIRILRMYVNVNEWYGRINVGDRAYLMDSEHSYCNLGNLIYEDNKYCNKANYKVVSVEIQNLKMKIEFEKII